MDAAQIWNNIVAYALQIGLLVGIGAALPALLRIGAPDARLRYWQVLLVACLALPWIRPWHAEVIAIDNAPLAATLAIARIQANAPARFTMPPITVIALWLLAAGIAARLVWLAAGLSKLARYRRHGQPIPLPPGWTGLAGRARLLISDQVGGPVTFGFFRPVVLLPASFPSMPAAMREAILFHELLHVERRDWLFTFGEELVRAVFWLHPAIWWVLGEIQLAREQTVDRAVIDMTQARDPYVDTLLAMAGVTRELDLAPAPLFLRRRHLKQRVMGIVREVRMSKTRMIFAQASALAAMAVACWFITGAVPLKAQPQLVADSAGVTVNLNGSQLMHRSPVMYPAEALAKGIEGTVVMQVRLDANGEVIDDAVLSGPDELRRAVQQSVLNWHFDKSAGSSTRVVNVDFAKPPANAVVPAAPTPTSALHAEIVASVTAPAPGGRGAAPAESASQATSSAQRPALQLFMQEQMAMLQQRVDQNHDPADAALLEQLKAKIKETQANAGRSSQPPNLDGTIDRIEVDGLSDSAKARLLAELPVHVGDPHSQENMAQLREAARQFDEHLTVTGSSISGAGKWTVRIATPGAPAFGPDAPAFGMNAPGSIPPGAQRIGGNVQASKIISQTRPVYPPLAKMARQQGTVKLEATIAKDGTIENLAIVSGPPLLIPAAMDAVKTWVYEPTYLSGAAVEVVTTIDVNFTLSE